MHIYVCVCMYVCIFFCGCVYLHCDYKILVSSRVCHGWVLGGMVGGVGASLWFSCLFLKLIKNNLAYEKVVFFRLLEFFFSFYF